MSVRALAARFGGVPARVAALSQRLAAPLRRLPRELTPAGRRWALAACALMMALRAPILILHPRLFAEQGRTYLAYAVSHGALRSLLLVPTSEAPAGYLLLSANLAATLSANVVPLEWAAALTTAITFAIQLVPFAIVLWGRSRWWTTAPRQLSCCAVLLFAPAIRPDLWLAAIHSQVFCGLIACLLLFEDLAGAGRRRIWTYRLLLLFCGLSGGYAGMLAIPYAIRAGLAKRREETIQAILVSATAIVQLICYMATRDVFAVAPSSRLGSDWLRVPMIVLLHQVVQPILGTALSGPGPGPEPRDLFRTVLAVLALGGLGVWLGRRRADPTYRLFLLTFVVLAAGTAFFGYGLPTGRYAVLPGLVVLLTLLVASWSEDPPAHRRTVCRILVGTAVAVGLATYWQDTGSVPKKGPAGFFGYLRARPDWPAEVGKWRLDPGYPLRIWPYNGRFGWRAALTRQGEFDEVREVLARIDAFHLVADRGPSEARIPLPAGLPADFKILIAGTSSHSSPQIALDVSLEAGDGATLGHVSVSEVRAEEHFVGLFKAQHFGLQPDRRLSETRNLVLTLESRAPELAVVAIDRISIAPRIEGLLDGVLPERTVPARLYSGSSVRPLSGEATPVLALESLVRDRDRHFAEEDRARAAQRWRKGPEGLRLREGDAGPVYDEPLPFLLAALPFFAAAGPAGVVVLNLLLLAVVAVLLWRDFAADGAAGRWYAVGSMLGAAGFGFAVLPQSQVFQMLCLFLPVRAWLAGRLTLASGLLLGLAAVEEPAWLVLAALILGERFLAGDRRAVARAAAGGLIVVLLLGALPAWLDPAGAAVPSDAGELVRAAPSGFFAEAWAAYAGRRGLLAGYPFVFLALWAMARSVHDRRRLVLLGGLVALTGWIIWQDAGGGRLGSPHFAVIFPLFALLPTRIGSWKWLLAPTAVAVLLSWGVASAGWTPP